jgi:hypothetical protein
MGRGRNHLDRDLRALVADLVGIFALQVTVLALVGAILGALFVLSLFPLARTAKAESFLLGSAYGLTLAVVLATLFNISIPTN